MSEASFRPRTVLILALVGGTSLLAFCLLLAFGDEFSEVSSHEGDAFSRSALGHHAFVALLEELDVPVVVSRSATARKLRDSSVLVVAEPPADPEQPCVQSLDLHTQFLGHFLAIPFQIIAGVDDVPI